MNGRVRRRKDIFTSCKIFADRIGSNKQLVGTGSLRNVVTRIRRMASNRGSSQVSC